MKKLRTNLRRLFIVIIVIWSKPDLYPLLIGAGLVIIGQLIHFISAGYLVKKDELTTAGPYRFTRNPFYIGNIFYDIGLCIMANNLYVAAIYLSIFYLIVIPRRIKKEEKFLADKFGEDYINYCRKVPCFIPRLPPAKIERTSGGFSWHQIIKHRELWRVMRALGLIIIFYLQFSIQYNLGGTTQWHYLFATPLNIALLCLLGLIIIIPPIVQYGVLQKSAGTEKTLGVDG